MTDTVTATGKQQTSRGPSVRLQRILAFILLLAQGGITVTGSIVRVTGSGLGCDTWPNCQEGSLVPVAGAAPAIHQAIEFGNRLLTFVLAAIAIAVFVAVLRAGRRREIVVYSLISGLGIVLQAVLGGISVILDLQWWTVAIHFLPSMILVWIAALLYMRLAEPDDGQPVRMFPQSIRTMTVIAAVALSVVLITGTMVTGAGVHSGDAGVGMEGRLEVDIELMAYIHAATMYLYLAATALVTWQLHRRNAPQAALRTAYVLIAMIFVQWAIGIIQFNLGIPRWTVPAHIAMSSVVVAFSAFLYAHGKRRVSPAPVTPKADANAPG
ncbi:cytochrome oxidase assembly protein [Corynebacterium marinum DSM 44953]|uniref:Cytochrome oxidase assembly protein n=1 Tax=Corynebacterium marinum DSM 44953 TaxID=1224162 RepID=A0A0B6TTM0_9CORY|nr:cytochrome oxidase assembly protein [Corynebacterium marinum DSM 44953]GGO19807.1 cytochrome oxidase assembly protein [Corynebacterium marinum]